MSSNRLLDAPSFARTSLSCFSFLIHITESSFLSDISLTAKMSTIKRFSEVCLVEWMVSKRLWLSVKASMLTGLGAFVFIPLEISETVSDIYNAVSHPSIKDRVSTPVVDLTTLLILDEFHDNGQHLLLSSHKKTICPP